MSLCGSIFRWYLLIIPFLAVVDVPSLTSGPMLVFGDDVSVSFELVFGDINGMTGVDISPFPLLVSIVFEFLVVCHRFCLSIYDDVLVKAFEENAFWVKH